MCKYAEMLKDYIQLSAVRLALFTLRNAAHLLFYNNLLNLFLGRTNVCVQHYLHSICFYLPQTIPRI